MQALGLLGCREIHRTRHAALLSVLSPRRRVKTQLLSQLRILATHSWGGDRCHHKARLSTNPLARFASV
jgi:hypothetical protein